jgi:hypothetical protein
MWVENSVRILANAIRRIYLGKCARSTGGSALQIDELKKTTRLNKKPRLKYVVVDSV